MERLYFTFFWRSTHETTLNTWWWSPLGLGTHEPQPALIPLMIHRENMVIQDISVDLVWVPYMLLIIQEILIKPNNNPLQSFLYQLAIVNPPNTWHFRLPWWWSSPAGRCLGSWRGSRCQTRNNPDCRVSQQAPLAALASHQYAPPPVKT